MSLSRGFVVLLAALLSVACSEAARESEFLRVLAPTGDWQIITTVIEPWAPQGPHFVVVYAQRGAQGARVPVGRAELAYDGIPCSNHNINLRWISDTEALVCLRASDRPDQSVHVTIRSAVPTGVLRKGC